MNVAQVRELHILPLIPIWNDLPMVGRLTPTCMNDRLPIIPGANSSPSDFPTFVVSILPVAGAATNNVPNTRPASNRFALSIFSSLMVD
ncbi:hypothetical protein ES703_23901 [subsurface metagenome]